MFKVRVPASTANLGPGFDCMGIALRLCSEAEFELIDKGIEINITNEGKDYVPKDENNLISRSMKYLFSKAGKVCDGVRVNVNSHIPVTRGLGSSSAAIVAGLVGANYLLDNRFSRDDLLRAACEIEGHPDNVTPALTGGFTVSLFDGKKVHYSKSDISSEIKFAAMIPEFYLPTRRSRSLLPDYTRFKNAAYNVAQASLLTAALSKGDTELLSVCFKDKLHQRYRFPQIKSGEYIIRAARRFGACGGYISGAGPTIMSVVCKEYDEFESKMNELIKTNLPNWRLVMLDVDNDGAYIEKSI